MCITITVGHSGSGNNAVIYFNATDGNRSLYGDRAFGWGGMGTPTDAEYTAMVTPYVLSWFGATAADLCGSCVPNWQCEAGQTGYEIDGCGNRRLNSACNPGTVPPGTSTVLIALVIVAILYYYFMMRGK